MWMTCDMALVDFTFRFISTPIPDDVSLLSNEVVDATKTARASAQLPVFTEQPVDSFVVRARPAILNCSVLHSDKAYFSCNGEAQSKSQDHVEKDAVDSEGRVVRILSIVIYREQVLLLTTDHHMMRGCLHRLLIYLFIPRSRSFLTSSGANARRGPVEASPAPNKPQWQSDVSKSGYFSKLFFDVSIFPSHFTRLKTLNRYCGKLN